MSESNMTAGIAPGLKWLTPPRLALAAVAFAIFVETVNTSIVPLALPALASAFAADFTRIQWVVLASVLTQAALSLVIGACGDFAGKRKVLIGGLILTGIGSVLCALAPTLNWLIAFRVVQGLGLTMAGALILGIATENFPESQRTQAFGFIGLMVSTGIVLGPLAGGLILKFLHWRWVFVFDLLFVIPAIPLAGYFLSGASGTGWQRFDVAGALAFACSLFAFLLASTLSQQATPFLYSLALYVVSGVAFLLFVIRELRTDKPLLDLRLFRSSEFSVYLTTRYISFFVYGGVWLLLPFFLETLLQLEPTTVGAWLAVHSAVFGLGSWVSGQLTHRMGRRPLLLTGLVLQTLAYGWLSFATRHDPLASFLIPLIMIGVGSGMLQPPANSIIFNSATRRNMGMISSLTAVVRIHSRSLGIAVLGGVWVYLAQFRLSRDAQASGVFTEAGAQIASFGMVCLLASLIMGVVLLVCLVESLRQYRRRSGEPLAWTGN